MMVTLLNLGINWFPKYSSPLLLITIVLVRTPPASGITTNSVIDKSSVSHGTTTPLTPNKKATMGVNAIRMMRSLVAT